MQPSFGRPGPFLSFPEAAVSWNGMYVPSVLMLSWCFETTSVESLPACIRCGVSEMLWFILKLKQCHWATVKETSVIISELHNFFYFFRNVWGFANKNLVSLLETKVWNKTKPQMTKPKPLSLVSVLFSLITGASSPRMFCVLWIRIVGCCFVCCTSDFVVDWQSLWVEPKCRWQADVVASMSERSWVWWALVHAEKKWGFKCETVETIFYIWV